MIAESKVILFEQLKSLQEFIGKIMMDMIDEDIYAQEDYRLQGIAEISKVMIELHNVINDSIV